MSDDSTAKNTDRELFREGGGDGNGMNYYDPSVFVTARGHIGMNVGGHVIVLQIRHWHRIADAAFALARATTTLPDPVERGCAACIGNPEAHGLHVCGKDPE